MPKFNREISLGNLLTIFSLIGGLFLAALSEHGRLTEVISQHRALQYQVTEMQGQMKDLAKIMQQQTLQEQENALKINNHLSVVHQACK